MNKSNKIIIFISIILIILLFTQCSGQSDINKYGIVNEENELIINGNEVDFIELDQNEGEIEIHMIDGEEFEFDIYSNRHTNKPKSNTTLKPKSTSKPTSNSKHTPKSKSKIIR